MNFFSNFSKCLFFLLVLPSIATLIKKFHCFPGICKYLHCEVKRECEYPKSYVKRKGGLCGCCDECRVVRFEGETCHAVIDNRYPPKLECRTGLVCDNYTFRCVDKKKKGPVREPPPSINFL